jgi:ribosome-binding protein aMBF1 (putative translation factor)|tara:strand:+ start:2222 stop:2533 length:312 start_codon:yes stop_codon:yes gene_type:complete
MENYQDWEEVKWVKPKKVISNKPKTNKKFNLLDSEEPPPPEKPSLQLRQKITSARSIKNLTQKKLAILLNIKVNTYINIENGKEKPTNQQLQRISKILGVNLR